MKLYRRKYLLLVFSLLTFTFFLSSCSKKLIFSTSDVVPAAGGYVKIKKDQNRNTAIHVSVTNLASPKRLNPPRNVYVVWMETRDEGTRNIGTIVSSGSLFSSKLKGSLRTVTPYKPTGFFITAEDASTVPYPGGYVVMRTK